MAIESKEIIMHIRKGTMISIRTSYRSARAHPYISGMLFFLLILYKAFPSLFAFLVSSSPVIVCTTLLLGTLLSYGTSNIPEIEEEVKTTREILSQQLDSTIDDIVFKKDETFIVDTHLETDKEIKEKAVEEAVGEASISAGNEMLSEMRTKEGREIIDFGFVKKKEFDAEEVHHVHVDNRNELEGFMVQISSKNLTDGPIDSSLGSPWQKVDDFDASSDYDSDGAESSSPDASMTDIIPMLDELHPLLDSENLQPDLKISDASDSDSELDEVEIRDDACKETEEKDESNVVSVPWTDDDQKSVMDLGYSEIERNRRLENLIAKRRLRKLQTQRFETERNLIDLDSYYPSSIQPILAPRRNPFDFPYDSGVPGSAPSILQPRQNPFDLPYDQEERTSTLSREYLNHHDFVSAELSRRNESSSTGPSLSGDVTQEQKSLNFNEETGFTSFERRLSAESDFKISFVSGSNIISSLTDHDHKEELIEPEMHHNESIILSPISHHVECVEKDDQSIDTVDFIDNGNIDFNTSTIIGETDEATNAFSAMEWQIGEVEDSLHISDSGKLEVIEERYEDSNVLSLEASEKISGASIHEEPAIPEEIIEGSMHSEQVDDAQTAGPDYDSSPSAIGKAHSNISMPDDLFFYEGTESSISNPLSSEAQGDNSEVASPQKPFEEIVSLDDQDLVVVKTEDDFASGIGELQAELSDISVVDENESRWKEIPKIKENNAIEIGTSESCGDSVICISPKAGAEESQARNLDLPSIPEEKSVDFNIEDNHKNAMRPPASFHLTDSQVVEESNDRIFDIEQESSTGNADLAINPVPEKNNGDSSVGSNVLELGLDNDSSDAQREMTDEILSNQDGEFLKNLNNPDKEWADDVRSQVSEINYIDEGLLSELDAVGDFHVEQETKSDRFDSIVEDSAISHIKDPDTSVEAGLVVEEPKPMKFEVGSSHLEDPEMTVYNSKLHVLEACTMEELDSIFKQEHEGATIENSETSKTEIAQELTETDTEMLVLEAQSVEDITSAVKHISESDNKSCVEVLPPKTHIDAAIENPETSSETFKSEIAQELIETDTDMLVLEAKSVEDITSALKQISESDNKYCVEFLPAAIENSDSSKSEKAQELTETDMDMLVLEAKSVEDITSALKQVSKSDNKSIFSEAERSTNLDEGKINLEIGLRELSETDTDMLFLEAKSVEDISSALKQVSEGATKSSVSEVQTSEVLPEEINSDLHVVEAKSLEDINLALKQHSKLSHIEPEVVGIESAETSERQQVEGQSCEISDEIPVTADVPSSSASKSRKARKKKPEKSGSDSDSSSSSSSSSDSE